MLQHLRQVLKLIVVIVLTNGIVAGISVLYLKIKTVQYRHTIRDLHKENTELSHTLERLREVCGPTVPEPPQSLIEYCYRHAHRTVPYQLVRAIVQESMRFSYPYLLLALSIAESSLRPWVTNGAKLYKNQAWGLTQIKPYVWAKELKAQGLISSERDLFDYASSLASANYILNKYYKQTNSWRKALLQYTGNNEREVDKIFSIYGELALLNSTEGGQNAHSRRAPEEIQNKNSDIKQERKIHMSWMGIWSRLQRISLRNH